MKEPLTKRVYVFIDGQNLYKSAKECYGYKFPNYNPYLLAKEIVNQCPDRKLERICFYTGIHRFKRNRILHHFWTKKIRMLKNIGVKVYSRYLQYDDKGKGREKGIDVKIALDLVRGYRKNEYDVAIIISQDTDLNEAVDEIYDMKSEFKRWVQIECAFICATDNDWGLKNANWIRITKELYDKCIDDRNYFPPKK